MERTELNLNFSPQWKPRGKELVAPGILIRQNVLCGSRGCILHPWESIKISTRSWDRKPVTFGHPQIGDVFVAAEDAPDAIIGHLESPFFQNGALKADIVITTQDPGIRQELQNTREVSVGLFSDEILASGEYKGKAYAKISQNYKPDHLAVLPPGEVGACSWESAGGCGIGANSAVLQVLREAAQDFFNSFKGGQKMFTNEVQPLYPPGVKEAEKPKTKTQEWDGPGVEPMLPPSLDRKPDTKTQKWSSTDEVAPMLPAGMNR